LPRLNIFIQLLLCHSLVLLISVSAIPKRTEPTRPPTLQGNKVFVISSSASRYAKPLQQCQNICLYTFMVLAHLQCPSGCYRRFVILLAVPPHSSRQLLCPSPHFIHFFLRYASFRFIHRLCCCLRSMVFNLHTQACHKTPILLQQAPLFIPLHFRYTTSFIHFSRVQSTRCP